MALKKIRKNKKDQINFKYNLRIYFSLLKKYKKLFTWTLIVILMTEALLVVDKFLFKRIIDDGTLFVDGTLPKEIFITTLIAIAGIFMGVIIFRTISRWITQHFVTKLESSLIFDLKRKYFNHIVGLSHEFHTTHKTGSLISRLARGTGAIEGMTDVIIFNFTPLIIQLIVVGASLAYFGLIPALMALIIVVIFIGYSYTIQRLQAPYKVIYNKRQDIERGLIGNVFTNIDSIKYFGKETYIKSKFKKSAVDTKSALIKYFNYFRWFDAGQLLILGIGTILLLINPLINFLHGEITMGTLVFVYTIYGNIVGPMFGFVWGLRGYYRVMADFQDLFQYGKMKNEVQNKKGAKKLRISKGQIEFKDINFGYYKNRDLFKKFNLKIKPNEKIALVGHSGCGKTTLLKLLYRLYDVDQGKILIDNKNITDVEKESLRGELSIVPQECILFNDTLYNNVAFSKPHAKRKEVLRAIKFAQLDKVIKDFPKKERTLVGERGVKLSGGEKQRVSIARAILANKKILVLDEATSALDSETEHEIQRDLRELLRERTSIIIAHRLSTIMTADRIIVMKRGKIIEQGKHQELLNQNGEYKKLWGLQKGGYLKD